MNLNNNTTGSYGLSIATSIAFETLFGIDSMSYDSERIFDRLDHNKFERCYINIFLIIRNIIESYDSNTKNIIINSSNSLLNNIILKEVEIIENLFKQSKSELVWLMPDYKKANITLFNKGKLSQKAKIYFKTIDILKQLKRKINDVGNILEDIKIEKTNKDILILTHISLDLLNFKYCKSLTLVETSTGHIVEKLDFNKKYHSSKKYNKYILPFNEVLLRIVGDGFLIEPILKDSKKIINNISLKYKWNKLTSEDKVKMNLQLDKDGKDLLNSVRPRLIYK